MLETGSVRFKNAQNILCKNLMVVCVGFLCWYVLGYGLAFGTTSGKFIGTDTFAGVESLFSFMCWSSWS